MPPPFDQLIFYELISSTHMRAIDIEQLDIEHVLLLEIARIELSHEKACTDLYS